MKGTFVDCWTGLLGDQYEIQLVWEGQTKILDAFENLAVLIWICCERPRGLLVVSEQEGNMMKWHVRKDGQDQEEWLRRSARKTQTKVGVRE